MEKHITTIQTIINQVVEFCINYSFQVIGACIILCLGVLIGKWIGSITLKLCHKHKIDVTLSQFLSTLANIIIVIFAIIIALGKFGITIAPFVAAIGAAAFGATYAIQGPLSNYGAGLSIIFGRPFKIGDNIKVAGINGIVKEIKMATTSLVNEDGIKITIPNKHIVGEIIHNSQEFRIVTSEIGVSYKNNPEDAINSINNSIKKYDVVSTNPVPQVGIKDFGESSINIQYRYWIPTKNYYQTIHSINLSIFQEFSRNNISIPFPQREILLKNEITNLNSQ